MTRALIVIAAVVVAACGEAPPSAGALRVDSAEPPYSPLPGGTVIEIHGSGFDANARVVIGGRESPLVNAVSTTALEVIVPPGATSGDAEVLVLENDTAISARDIFRYSSAPVIASVSPDHLVSSPSGDRLTVTGAGFLDEGAGDPVILVDGLPVSDVVVVDDSTLTFTTQGGRAFARPTVDLTNTRGRAFLPHAFRYVPSESPGLLLFTRFGGSFAYFFDLTTQTMVPIPVIPTAQQRMRTVVRDSGGTYWGIDTANQLGVLDLETQTLVSPLFMPDRISAVTRVGDVLYALRRSDASIGVIDKATGAFAPGVTGSLQCCGSYSIASDGTTLWFTSRAPDFQTIWLNSFDVVTRTLGTPIALTGGPPGFRVEELRIVDGVFYGVGPQMLAQIDPQTGIVTQLGTPIGESFIALELYVPEP